MLYNNRATDVVQKRPTCDVCLKGSQTQMQPAAVDAATSRGPWAYMCTEHHEHLGDGRLGLGVGQVLLCGDDLDDELKKYYKLEGE